MHHHMRNILSPTTKKTLLLCIWKCLHFLFLLRWHILALGGWFVVDEAFFFLFFLSPHLKMTTFLSLLLAFQIQFLFFWFLIFFLNPFYKCFICFNFIIQSQLIIYFFSFNLIHIFLISIFFLVSFVICFQFHPVIFDWLRIRLHDFFI
jgi:hypothetical protein